METRRLGFISYEDAWKIQLDLLEQRSENLIPDTLLIVEHPDVITLGRKSPEVRGADIQEIPKSFNGVPVFAVERGGEATYHGPGQLVLYPIFRVDERLGPKAFLRMLENHIITLLSTYGLHAYAIDGKTGVWIRDVKNQERKIASLGISVRKDVSYHGLALNISTDLSKFSLISPCGFAPEVMTSMAELLLSAPSLNDAAEKMIAIFSSSLSARVAS